MPKTALDDAFLTVRELVEYLGIKTATVYDWHYRRKHGEDAGPPVHRAGNRLRYRKSEVDAWLARDQESAG
jgi:predicted DNA-binding transcriptional regulator AlpA